MEIQGRVESIVFQNEDNGYTVVRVLAEGDLITCVGHSLKIERNLDYLFRGEWTFHPSYQEQFVFKSLEVVKPTGKEATIRYLSSGILPYIGPKTAEDIVNLLGEDALDQLEKNPDLLLKIPGLGKKKLEKIKEALAQQEGMEKVVLWCEEKGLSIKEGIRVYKALGPEAISILREDPYLLLNEIRGLSFQKVDQMALSLGLEKDSPQRMKAGILYVLREDLNLGSCYIEYEDLRARVSSKLDLDPGKFLSPLGLAMDPYLMVEQRKDQEGAYFVYLNHVYRCEKNIAQDILARLREESSIFRDLGRESLEKNKKDWFKNLSKDQYQAVEESLNTSIFVLTGGPGTGKTTTLRAMIQLYESMDKKVLLAAPTGRAAKKMSESTKRSAQTIHRLLDLSPQDHWMDVEESQSEIQADVLILDELSMVDVFLMYQVLKALKRSTKLILVGDHNQLSSVGPGNVLGDILASPQIPRVELTKIFRQAEKSTIVKNAHHILKNEDLSLNEKGGDFFFIQALDKDIPGTLVDLIENRLPDYFNVNPMEDIQVLSPMHKGPVGVTQLNSLLQEALNPKEEGQEDLRFKGQVFRKKDRVMHIKNNYQLQWSIDQPNYSKEGEGVFNGDTGRVVSVDPEEKSLEVLYDEIKLVKYTETDLEELTLSYASTIHKAQGSEYPIIILICSWAPPMLQTKNLLYTAITRGRQAVVLVGNPRYLKEMLENRESYKRRTSLTYRLDHERILEWTWIFF